MGWLLDIANFARQTKIKCTRCGFEGGVYFIGREGEDKMIVKCQGCGAESRIDAPNILAEPPKSLE